jgi:hypothetical protein
VAPSRSRRPLVAAGARHTSTFTCNAQAFADAGPFWESMGFVSTDTPMGFVSTDTPGITHIRVLQ